MNLGGPWIRGPIWDSCFILSGLPLGLALLCLTGPWYDWPNPQHYGQSRPLMLVFMLMTLPETGHSLSPIALAWSHRGFRRLMLERKAKFILLPGAVFLGAAGIGAATSLGLTSFVNVPSADWFMVPGTDDSLPHRMFFVTGLSNPFPILVWVYMIWNAYHFGMQNFGVLQIYRRRDEAIAGLRANLVVADCGPQRGITAHAGGKADASASSRNLRQPDRRRAPLPKAALDARRVDKLFCLTVTCAAMVTGFPVAWLHSIEVRDICVALSLVATIGMLWRELVSYLRKQSGDHPRRERYARLQNQEHQHYRQGIHPSIPRFVFILADGLGLALVWWLPIVGFTVYSLNHWLVAIGLSGHVFSVGAPRGSKRVAATTVGVYLARTAPRYRLHLWLFVIAMLALGSVGFVWLIPTPSGTQLRVVPYIIAARLGLGFVHFLYDRWIWRMSDPEVRATIGRDLFPPPPLRLVA